MEENGWSDEEMEKGLDRLDELRTQIVQLAVDWAGYLRTWNGSETERTLDILYNRVEEYLDNLAKYGWENRR